MFTVCIHGSGQTCVCFIDALGLYSGSDLFSKRMNTSITTSSYSMEDYEAQENVLCLMLCCNYIHIDIYSRWYSRWNHCNRNDEAQENVLCLNYNNFWSPCTFWREHSKLFNWALNPLCLSPSFTPNFILLLVAQFWTVHLILFACRPVLNLALDPICSSPRFGITRAHLEEDSGKTVYGGADRLAGSEYSLVDFNRAGVLTHILYN